MASFVYSLEFPQPDVPVTFNASGSYDPDGRIVAYHWNFGDGFVSDVAESVTTHTFSNDGSYQVLLRVEDNGGASSTMAVVLTVNSNVWFRIVDPSGNPISNVTVTVYRGDSANSTNWQIAPANNNGVEVKYDYLTQPNKANNPAERFRNPGITASILDLSANIGFEAHPPNWYTFFKFQWGSNVFYWPNETSRVFSYKQGNIETHYYNSGHEAVFNQAAGTYVIKTRDIPGNGVAPAPEHPIILFGQATSALGVLISPTNVTMDVGQSQTFNSTTFGGSPPLTYQWYLDNSLLVGGTAPTWTLAAMSPGSHTCYLNVTDSSGKNAESNIAVITVNAVLSVTISPESAILGIGQSQPFTSNISGGTPPFSYQWYLDGTPANGATASTWMFSSSVPGTYQVYLNVTDSLGVEAKSNVATVIVSSELSVVVSPTEKTIDLGQSQLFTSIVSGGTAPYTYQWYLNGTAISGATNEAWTFTPTSTGTYFVHLVVVDAQGKNATSSTAIIIVNPALLVSISPISATLDVGQPQLFTSNVSGGTLPYAYQWFLNGVAVSGATDPTWVFIPVSGGSYTVYVQVTGSTGAMANSPIANVLCNAPLGVTISPSITSIELGQYQTFTSSVSGGTSPFAYQWYLNGSLVSGAASGTWTFTPAAIGIYEVNLNVTDAVNAVAWSNTAQLNVTQPALSISIVPVSSLIDVGQSVFFNSSVCACGGTLPFTYKWYLNDVWVPGVSGPTWNASFATVGSYTVYATVTDGQHQTAKSNIATVLVNSALTVSITPTSVTMDVGQSQLFSALVSGGTSPYSYQWYLNDSIVPGATSISWDFTPISPGFYNIHVNVTDSVGVTAKSNVALITVNAAPTVSILPSLATLTEGDSQLFTSTTSGGTPPYAYQWYLDGALVSGATNPTWMFSQPVGTYKVYLNITDSVGLHAKSNVATVSVLEALSVSISPESALIRPGGSAQFFSTVTNGISPYTYQWYLDGVPGSGATQPSWTFTSNSTGSYLVYLNVTDSMGHTAKSNVARVRVANGAVGGFSKENASLPFLASWFGVVSLLVAAFLLRGIIVKKKRN